MSEVVLTGARLLNGVTAGIYIAFLVAFMPALHGQPDDVYARVMNRLNVVIVNPVFLAFFLGAPLLALILLGWHRSPLSVTAACLAVAAVVITFAANLPLNDALANGGAVGSNHVSVLVRILHPRQRSNPARLVDYLRDRSARLSYPRMSRLGEPEMPRRPVPAEAPSPSLSYQSLSHVSTA